MGSPVALSLVGAVTAQQMAVGQPGFQDFFQLGVLTSYQLARRGQVDVQASSGAPYVLGLENMQAVRFIVAKFSGPSMQLLLSSPNGGADQKVSSSDIVIVHAPAGGDEITAIKIVGFGSMAYLIAGNGTG